MPQPEKTAATWASLKAIADAHTVGVGLVTAGALLRMASELAWPSMSTAPNPVLRGVFIAFYVLCLLLVPAALFILARALGDPGALLYAFGGIPLLMLGVLLFAFLTMTARRRLRAAGVEVGPVLTRLPASPPPHWS